MNNNPHIESHPKGESGVSTSAGGQINHSQKSENSNQGC